MAQPNLQDSAPPPSPAQAQAKAHGVRGAALAALIPWCIVSGALLYWLATRSTLNITLFLITLLAAGLPAGKLVLEVVLGMRFTDLMTKWSSLPPRQRLIATAAAVPFLLLVPIGIAFAIH